MIDRFISSYEVFFDARVEKPVPTCSSFALVSDQGKKEGMINLERIKKIFYLLIKNLLRKNFLN